MGGNLFNIGPMELILVLVVALIVFGPQRIPEVASKLGRVVREIRKIQSDVTNELAREVRAVEEATKQGANPDGVSVVETVSPVTVATMSSTELDDITGASTAPVGEQPVVAEGASEVASTAVDDAAKAEVDEPLPDSLLRGWEGDEGVAPALSEQEQIADAGTETAVKGSEEKAE